jgi:hypothetical protein
MSDNGRDDDQSFNDTPPQLPQVTLKEHRPYVLALISIVAPLQEAVHRLTSICHEIRVARDPIGARTVEEIGKAGAQIELVGKSIRTAFGG